MAPAGVVRLLAVAALSSAPFASANRASYKLVEAEATSRVAATVAEEARVTRSNSTALGEAESREALREAEGSPQATICRAGAHTYVDMGDGGCYVHLLTDGNFQSAQDSTAYNAKNCPFPHVHSRQHVEYRRLLVEWYTLTLTNPCNEPGEKEHEDECGLGLPFNVNDLGAACINGNPNDISSNFRVLFRNHASSVSNAVLCHVMMQLPLMWDSVGWDGTGVVMQDPRIRYKWTYNGHTKGWTDVTTKGPGDSATGFSLMFRGDIGESAKVRLALRAILPTYYLHIYPSQNGMIARGIRSFAPGKFSSSYWEGQVSAVKQALSTGSVDQLDMVMNPGNRHMISDSVLERDESKHGCKDVDECGHSPDPSQKKVCGICDWQPEYPCAELNDLGTCWSKTPGVGQCKLGTKECLPDEPESCDCYKAICWYFTSDLKAVAAVM